MDLEAVYDKIYRYVCFKIKDRATAEDITQETFLRAIDKRGSAYSCNIRYLYTIAKNLCVDEYRRIRPDPISEEYEHDQASSDRSLEDVLAVREAVAKLPIEDQEILLLRYVNNESVNTVSKALGISRFAVYRRLKSAEDKLRKDLVGGMDI